MSRCFARDSSCNYRRSRLSSPKCYDFEEFPWRFWDCVQSLPATCHCHCPIHLPAGVEGWQGMTGRSPGQRPHIVQLANKGLWLTGSLAADFDVVVTGEARRARPESPASARARPGVTVSTAGAGPGPGLGHVWADDGPATSLSWWHSVTVSRVTWKLRRNVGA